MHLVAHPKAPSISPAPSVTVRRTYWRDPSLPKWIGVPVHTTAEKEERLRDERLEMVDDLRDAHFVSSLLRNGRHAPALDIDFPVSAEPLSFGWTRLTLHQGIPSRYHLHGRIVEADAWTPVFDLLADFGWTKRDLCSVDAQNVSIALGVPVHCMPSSSPGCHHLYIDAELTWGRYADLLGLLFVAGVLGGHTYPWTIERAQSMLLRPGLSKARVRAEFQLDMFAGRAARS